MIHDNDGYDKKKKKKLFLYVMLTIHNMFDMKEIALKQVKNFSKYKEELRV